MGKASATGGSALRVLVVEDNPDSRRFVREVLLTKGLLVTEAADGSEALLHVAEQRFDLILTDLEMPELDGASAARAIRALEREQRREPTPIVALTAQDAADARASAEAAGMNGYLVKPVRTRELLEAVKRFADARDVVLVVDDDDHSRALTSAWLADTPNVRVIGAARAGAAIACVKRERVDLVLLDMVMPGIDGYAAARLLRAIPGARELPIVAVTAHAGAEARAKCLAAGCTDHLAKPLQKGMVRALLATYERAPWSLPPSAASVPLPAPAQAAQPDPDPDLDPAFFDDALVALLPAFFESREADRARLRTALGARDFAALVHIGHGLRGSGGSYGFPALTEIGEEIERGGNAQDTLALARALLRYERELDALQKKR